MSDNILKEIFHRFVSSKSFEDIREQMNEEMRQMKMSDITSTIVVPDVGISSEELNRQLLITSQIIQKQSQIEILNELKCMYASKESLEDSLQELSGMASNLADFSSDIPLLKKRIKYCKNPLERKSLERQLNDVYKEMKKRRRENGV